MALTDSSEILDRFMANEDLAEITKPIVCTYLQRACPQCTMSQPIPPS